MAHDDLLQVDLNLAHTYIPAIWCLVKSCCLIFLVANTNVISNPPWLLCVASLLVLDKVTRFESIFDSNSLVCTIAASYVVDSVRTGYPDSLLLAGRGGSHGLYAGAASWASVVLSCVMITEPDALNTGVLSTQSQLFTVLHIALLSIVAQTPLLDEHRTHHDSIMTRSLAFMGLSLVWTYTRGIRNMVTLLGSACRLPLHCITNSKPGSLRKPTHSTIVQSFVPCFVRFSGVLFLDGWSQTAMTLAGTALLVYKASQCHPRETHPEYTTTASRDVIPDMGNTPPLFLQQDTGRASKNMMSIKNSPLEGTASTHSSADRLRHGSSSGSIVHTEQQQPPKAPADAPPQALAPMDDEEYMLFAMAKRQAKESTGAPVALV